MIDALLLMASLQTAPADLLMLEGERLGRYSTLFALCEPYYATDIEAGGRLADDFERRSTEAGWARAQTTVAYTRGRDLERSELGVLVDMTGVTSEQASHRLREMFPRLKRRCRDLAREVPGSISDVETGDRRLDDAARAYR